MVGVTCDEARAQPSQRPAEALSQWEASLDEELSMYEAEPGVSDHNEDERPQATDEPAWKTVEAEEAGDASEETLERAVCDEEVSDLVDDPQPHAVYDRSAEIGVEVLRQLLDLLGLEGDVECERVDDSVVLNIEGDDLGVLIGRRGMTLSALQHIVRLMIATRESDWPALTIDVCGYKRRRHTALQDLARKLADQARYRRRSMALEPMPPDERRVVHLVLANHPDVYTESVGEDIDRKVVIHPKGR